MDKGGYSVNIPTTSQRCLEVHNHSLLQQCFEIAEEMFGSGSMKKVLWDVLEEESLHLEQE